MFNTLKNKSSSKIVGDASKMAGQEQLLKVAQIELREKEEQIDTLKATIQQYRLKCIGLEERCETIEKMAQQSMKETITLKDNSQVE